MSVISTLGDALFLLCLLSCSILDLVQLNIPLLYFHTYKVHITYLHYSYEAGITVRGTCCRWKRGERLRGAWSRS